MLCSFLEIQPGGARGSEVLRVGFTGPAIIRSEYLGAHELRLGIETVKRRSGPSVIMDRFRRLSIEIDAGPGRHGDLTGYDEGTLILLGSRVYNRLTRKYLDDSDDAFFAWVRAPNNERTFAPRSSADNNLPYRRSPGPGEHPASVRTCQLAVIERHWDRHHNRWVFILAGIGALATTGAAKYLAENWRVLERRIRKGLLEPQFGLLLEFPDCLPDLDREEDLSDIPAPIVLRVADRATYAMPVDGTLT